MVRRISTEFRLCNCFLLLLIVTFLCNMFSAGPYVVLDSQYLDMGVVESGKFVAKSFKILNNTEVPAAFQVNYQVLNALG